MILADRDNVILRCDREDTMLYLHRRRPRDMAADMHLHINPSTMRYPRLLAGKYSLSLSLCAPALKISGFRPEAHADRFAPIKGCMDR